MNILRDKKYIADRYGEGISIEDDRLEFIDIFMLPHYGHLVCLEFYLKKYRHAIHNDTKNIGAILHQLSSIFNLPEDGMRLCELSQAYKGVRSVWIDSPFGKQCVGVGHSWEDKFILFDEFHLAEV